MTTEPIIPIVLCGGAGTRLWPVSRRDFAKQHAPILQGASPFRRTLERLAHPCFEAPIVVVGQAGRFLAAEQAAEAGVTVEMLLEPEGRDTAAAIAAAAGLAARRRPDAVAMAFPSDHVIDDLAAFRAAAAAAARAAASGLIATVGVRPDGPATGFGYIRPGAPTAGGARRVAAFVEKPDAARAAALIAEGCLWNAGMFCFRVDALMEEAARLTPATAAAAAEGLAGARDDLGALLLDAAFARAPRVSFDHAVMEKTDRAAVVEAELGWSDVGDWRAVWRRSPRDDAGNAAAGAAVLRDCRDSYVRADGRRLVCALGTEGLAVVDTPDAVLVAPLDRAQEVRALVAELADAGRPEATAPARVRRPWGWHQTVDRGERFRVKRIQVAPGRRLSLQKHHHRAEHWVVVRGAAEVTRDGETLLVRENESVYLPAGCVHRLGNPGRIPVELIEVQTGAYLEEDDIVRLEDDYDRA
jgi:mannose-1-phosphate guanylyltransferase/mannose-6-phosphate isomerase